MDMLTNLIARGRTPLLICLGLLAAACAGEDLMTGTWAQSDAQTPLPDALGGGMLDIDAEAVLDGANMPGTFTLEMNLSAMGLMDTMTVQGTYIDAGDTLDLTITGFVVDSGSSNEVSVAADDSQCIVLQGFAGTPVCFPATQSNPYTADGDVLNMTVQHSIAGAPVSQTTFNFARVP